MFMTTPGAVDGLLEPAMWWAVARRKSMPSPLLALSEMEARCVPRRGFSTMATVSIPHIESAADGTSLDELPVIDINRL